MTPTSPRLMFASEEVWVITIRHRAWLASRLPPRLRRWRVRLPEDAGIGAAAHRLDAEVQVNRADFGLTWNQMGMTSMQNTITVHAVFGKR